jgi:hypothetical protein
MNIDIKNRPVAPLDENEMILKIFFIWGIGVLLPWSAVLNALDYFMKEVGHILSKLFNIS